MKPTRLLIAIAIFAACVFAQAPLPGIDYPSPIPVPFIGYTTGYSNPGLCVPGLSPLFFNQTAGAFYGCTARNTWTAPSITGAISGTTGTFSSTVTTTSPRPALVGTSMIGSAAAPWLKLYLGTAATNNFVFTPASTAAARVITIPDPGGAATMNFARLYNGGTTSTYTPAAEPTMIVHSGSAALVSTGSASPVTIATFSPAFTSATSYVCAASPQGGTAAIAAGGLAVVQTNGGQIVITGPSGVSTVANYICVGN
jgi:hypothetical protein